jgi:membrane-associated phospholipid phosphatase
MASEISVLKEQGAQATPSPVTPLRVALAALSCVVLVIASIAFVDRPLATWVHDHFNGVGMLPYSLIYQGRDLPVSVFTVMAAPAEVLAKASTGGLIIMGAAGVLGWRPRRRGHILLAICVAVLITIAVKDDLKWIFGRTWPESWLQTNPSWIRDHIDNFRFFHGWVGRASFPSGHMAVVAAAATVLWNTWPKTRPLALAVAIVAATGLIAGNYHFLSDVIAGCYLGGGIGLVASAPILRLDARRMGEPDDPGRFEESSRG